MLITEINMKNCDTCINFIKINFNDRGAYKQKRGSRKGICIYTDYNIIQMKGKPCQYYKSKKYIRNVFK